jgi:SAM-dependent methyltransferase
VPDPIYAHERLAAVYDAFDGPRDDLAAYLAIADEVEADVVVDVGCGTGSLAVLLTQSGRRVIGVDPAAAVLAVARGKALAGQVTWIHGVAADLPDLDADLAVMTGNAAQAVLTDADWTETLVAIRRSLRPGGVLAFETRRPEARDWESWASPSDRVSLDVPGFGVVERRFALTDVAWPYVSFRHDYRFADGVRLTSDSTIRFRTQVEVTTDLVAAGLRVREVRDAPDRPGLELVFLADRPG